MERYYLKLIFFIFLNLFFAISFYIWIYETYSLLNENYSCEWPSTSYKMDFHTGILASLDEDIPNYHFLSINLRLVLSVIPFKSYHMNSLLQILSIYWRKLTRYVFVKKKEKISCQYPLLKKKIFPTLNQHLCIPWSETLWLKANLQCHS